MRRTRGSSPVARRTREPSPVARRVAMRTRGASSVARRMRGSSPVARRTRGSSPENTLVGVPAQKPEWADPERLEVRDAGGGMGLGVFARTTIRRGDVVTEYAGTLRWSPFDGIKAGDPRASHMLTLLHQLCAIDGLREPVPGAGVGSFVNDARGSGRPPNAKYAVDPVALRATVVAVDTIRAGDQVFTSYGRRYWAEHK